MKFECTAWVVRDSYGLAVHGIVSDSCDIVQVSGLHDSSGNSVYFKAEFYRLSTWCINNDIVFASQEHAFELPL